MHGGGHQLAHQRTHHHHADKGHGHGQHIGLYHAPQVVGAQAAVGADDGTAHQKRHDCRHVEGKDDGCEAAVQLAGAGGCRGKGGRGGGGGGGEGTGEGAFWLYWERGG